MDTFKNIMKGILMIPFVFIWFHLNYYAYNNINDFLAQYPTITFILRISGIIPDNPIEVGIQVVFIVIALITVIIIVLYIIILVIFTFVGRGINWMLFKLRIKKGNN